MLFRHRGSQVFVIISSRTLFVVAASDNLTSVNVLENLFLAVVVLFRKATISVWSTFPLNFCTALQCSLDGEVAAGAALSPRLSLQG